MLCEVLQFAVLNPESLEGSKDQALEDTLGMDTFSNPDETNALSKKQYKIYVETVPQPTRLLNPNAKTVETASLTDSNALETPLYRGRCSPTRRGIEVLLIALYRAKKHHLQSIKNPQKKATTRRLPRQQQRSKAGFPEVARERHISSSSD